MNAAIVVANQATHFNTLTILSPVGDFCDIINLNLINNFSISTANIHFFLIYANLMRFFGVYMELYWSCIRIKTCSSGGLCGGA